MNGLRGVSPCKLYIGKLIGWNKVRMCLAAHPIRASLPSGVAFILESRDPSEDFPFGSDQVFEALPERERPTGPP